MYQALSCVGLFGPHFCRAAVPSALYVCAEGPGLPHPLRRAPGGRAWHLLQRSHPFTTLWSASPDMGFLAKPHLTKQDTRATMIGCGLCPSRPLGWGPGGPGGPAGGICICLLAPLDAGSLFTASACFLPPSGLKEITYSSVQGSG